MCLPHVCLLSSFSKPHSFRVFVSYRLGEAATAAERLKAALEPRGITSFVSHLDSTGGNIAEDIVTALVGCDLFVILGTKSFGEKTDIGFSSYAELGFACDEGKPLFLIKMFDQGDFTEPMTRFRLQSTIPFVLWPPGTAVPAEVIDGIAARLGVP
jgi:hypothetical protein